MGIDEMDEHIRNSIQHLSSLKQGKNVSLFEKINKKRKMKKALQKREFSVYYQPQIDVKTGEIVGAEALLRWLHPDKGMILPGSFIPIAERTGFITNLGEMVLRESCNQAVAWQKKGIQPIRMGVNLSLAQLLQKTFHQKIREILDETSLQPFLLELEITESMTMDVEYTSALLEKLKKLGVLISIDDFGSGYSSLAHLKKFGVDRLKIDRSFIKDIPGGRKDTAITLAIITLAKNLDLQIVAEGVETDCQFNYLYDQNCDEVQGFMFSKPVPADQFEQLLIKQPFKQKNPEVFGTKAF